MVVCILCTIASDILTKPQVLFPSPRNSETAFLHVLNATKSSKFFFSAEQQKVVEQLQQANKNLQSWEVPGLWEMFDTKVDCYPFVKQYADVEDEAPIIIHSSGTTGKFNIFLKTFPSNALG